MFREGDKKDIGFFKLFLSTRPAHFSSILQQSPFEIDRSRTGRVGTPDLPIAEVLWGAKLVTVIQVDS